VNHYLYAVVDRIPPAWQRPPRGIDGAAVVPQRVDDVVVLASVIESVPPATPRTLAVHQDVVGSVMDAAALLPFHYGTTVPFAAVSEWLAARRVAVTAALAGVRDCVEMSVKLLRLDCAIDQQLARRRGLVQRIDSGPGERELRVLADALVERAAVSKWDYRPSGSAGNVVGSVAFLVPRPDLTGFLSRIAPVASRAVGVAVVPTGPWPPYSFVPPLDRAPLGRVSTPPGFDAADRRVG
jgi:hypothetical protein